MIDVKHLVKDFETKENKKGWFEKQCTKKVHVVRDINFYIKSGQKVGFIGPNGAGKSTTIKMMTGIIAPTSGSILVNGFTPFKEREKLTKIIGCMFGQRSALWMHLTAMESYQLMGAIYDIEKDVLKKRIQELVEMLDAEEIINRPVKTLSLGQRMKAEMIAHVLNKPKILFLDEPTIGLDIIAKESIREVIEKLNKEEGTTIFLTSHDIFDIEKICERIITIQDGCIVLDENIRQLKENYQRNQKINIVYEGKINYSNLEGLYVTQLNEHFLSFEYNTKKDSITSILTRISEECHIYSLETEDVSLEEIVSQIYKKRSIV